MGACIPLRLLAGRNRPAPCRSILQRVIEDCPNLTELSIGYSNVRRVCVLHLQSRHAQHVTRGRATAQVTAGVVEELLRRLPGMKKLQLHWSTCLT